MSDKSKMSPVIQKQIPFINNQEKKTLQQRFEWTAMSMYYFYIYKYSKFKVIKPAVDNSNFQWRCKWAKNRSNTRTNPDLYGVVQLWSKIQKKIPEVGPSPIDSHFERERHTQLVQACLFLSDVLYRYICQMPK